MVILWRNIPQDLSKYVTARCHIGVEILIALINSNKTVHLYISELDISFLDIEEFLLEGTITKGFDHPNVLKVIGVSIAKRDCYVVLPFMEKGNLREFLLDAQNVSLLQCLKTNDITQTSTTNMIFSYVRQNPLYLHNWLIEFLKYQVKDKQSDAWAYENRKSDNSYYVLLDKNDGIGCKQFRLLWRICMWLACPEPDDKSSAHLQSLFVDPNPVADVHDNKLLPMTPSWGGTESGIDPNNNFFDAPEHIKTAKTERQAYKHSGAEEMTKFQEYWCNILSWCWWNFWPQPIRSTEFGHVTSQGYTTHDLVSLETRS